MPLVVTKDELLNWLSALSGPLKPHDNPVNGSSMPLMSN